MKEPEQRTDKKKKPAKKKDLLERLHKETGRSKATLFYMIKLGMYI